MIEKNIFQLSKTKPPSLIFRRYVKSFSKQKGYQHFIYTDQDMDLFVRQNYSGLFETYIALPLIQKTDLLRLLLVYHFGGLYSDLDTFCKVSLDTLFLEFPDAEIIVGLEADTDEETKETFELARTKQICNWTFAARKGNSVLKAVIDAVINNIKNNPDLPTLDKTGPGILTDVILNTKNTDGVKILPVHYFCAGVPYESQELLKDGYILHKFWGSWKKNNPLRYKILFYIDCFMGEKFTQLVRQAISLLKK